MNDTQVKASCPIILSPLRAGTEKRQQLTYQNRYKDRGKTHEKVKRPDIPIDHDNGEDSQEEEEFCGKGEVDILLPDLLFQDQPSDDLLEEPEVEDDDGACHGETEKGHEVTGNDRDRDGTEQEKRHVAAFNLGYGNLPHRLPF